MKKYLIMTIALLCAVVQGAWAQEFDVWDGHTLEEPNENITGSSISITKASQLAYLSAHWKDYEEIFLNADIDMGETS